MSESVDITQPAGSPQPAPESTQTPAATQPTNQETPVQANQTPPPTEPSTPPQAPSTEQPPQQMQDTTHYEYPTLQNPDAQSIIDVFKERNVDPGVLDTVFAKALQTGNVEDIDQKALQAALGASANLVLGMARKVADDNRRATEQAIKEVHDASGGKEAWEAMAAWANNLAATDAGFNAKLATYRSMIDAGGEQRRLAVRALKETYMNDPNVTVHPNLLTGDLPSGPAVGDPIKSNKEYSELLQAAYKARDADAVESIQRRWRAGAGNPNAPKTRSVFPY